MVTAVHDSKFVHWSTVYLYKSFLVFLLIEHLQLKFNFNLIHNFSQFECFFYSSVCFFNLRGLHTEGLPFELELYVQNSLKSEIQAIMSTCPSSVLFERHPYATIWQAFLFTNPPKAIVPSRFSFPARFSKQINKTMHCITPQQPTKTRRCTCWLSQQGPTHTSA